jgi:hypothetical protein
MAKAFAGRVLREEGETDPSRLEYGFRLVTSRFPKPNETDRILSWLRQGREYFTAHADEARKIAGEGAGSADRAAWTMVANVLLNLDEALTKE